MDLSNELYKRKIHSFDDGTADYVSVTKEKNCYLVWVWRRTHAESTTPGKAPRIILGAIWDREIAIERAVDAWMRGADNLWKSGVLISD